MCGLPGKAPCLFWIRLSRSDSTFSFWTSRTLEAWRTSAERGLVFLFTSSTRPRRPLLPYRPRVWIAESRLIQAETRRAVTAVTALYFHSPSFPTASYFRGPGLASKASAEGETPHVALTNPIVPRGAGKRKPAGEKNSQPIDFQSLARLIASFHFCISSTRSVSPIWGRKVRSSRQMPASAF